MTKRFYQDNPPRYEYLLTEMGRDFFPVLAAMLSWGDKWLDDGGGAAVNLHHHKPGHTIVSQVVCGECGEPIVHADIEFCVGPVVPTMSPLSSISRSRLAPATVQSGGYPYATQCPLPRRAGKCRKVRRREVLALQIVRVRSTRAAQAR